MKNDPGEWRYTQELKLIFFDGGRCDFYCGSANCTAIATGREAMAFGA